MEIESKNGSKIRVHADIIDFGRGGLGFDSTEDRTVSRRHISLKLNEDGTRVYFHVTGKNPILVRDSGNGDIRVFKSSERGELKTGDSFCVASKNPVWFDLKRSIACEDDESDSKIRYDEAFAAEISGIGPDEIETADISDIDPVKEFNFVVMGHEFDCYPKKLIRDIRSWNWFLEEPNDDRDEDDDNDENSEKKSRKSASKKRKKGGRKDDDDDDVWAGESEEDVEFIKKSRNDLKPKYSTRSKDKNKKGAGASKRAKDNATSDDDDDDEEDNGDNEEEDEEDDETLGGFIVDDEDIGEGNEEDDEEEEFEENEEDE